MLDKTKPVQGYMVYAEFRKGGSTTQMMFLPDIHTSAGRMVHGRIMMRTVSADSPKKQWQSRSVHTKPVADLYDAPRNTGAESSRKRRGALRGEYTETFIMQMLSGGWAMNHAPLTIEVSHDDADSIDAGKTPTKLIYRLGQCRAAAGYPADLF